MVVDRRALLAFASVAFIAPDRTALAQFQHVSTSFGDIAYRTCGSGPSALFLHGFPLSSYQWRDVMDALKGARRCLAPDFMGLGETRVSARQALAPLEQARMLAAFLDALDVGVVDMVANDSGGAVAQLFLAQWPERVRSLLLTNCDCEYDCPPAALTPVIDLARRGRYAQEWLVPWANDFTLARSARGLGGMCYSVPGQPTDAALRSYLEPLTRNAERLSQTNRFAVALEHNSLAGVEPHLRACMTPIRIIWGQADAIFAASTPAYFQTVFRSVQGVRILPAAKLFFPEEYPGVIAQEAAALWNVQP